MHYRRRRYLLSVPELDTEDDSVNTDEDEEEDDDDEDEDEDEGALLVLLDGCELVSNKMIIVKM